MKWLWHSQGSDEKRHPLIEYEFTKRVISTKRISIKYVPHFDISIESRPRPLKASHVSYLNLQAINLNLNTSCAAKFSYAIDQAFS